MKNVLLFLAAVCLLSFAGCGGNGDGESTAPQGGDVAGHWEGTGNGVNVIFDIVQSGSAISGNVAITGLSGVGQLSGTVSNDMLTFTINWASENIVYTGNGTVNGNTINGVVQHQWQSRSFTATRTN